MRIVQSQINLKQSAKHVLPWRTQCTEGSMDNVQCTLEGSIYRGQGGTLLSQDEDQDHIKREHHSTSLILNLLFMSPSWPANLNPIRNNLQETYFEGVTWT